MPTKFCNRHGCPKTVPVGQRLCTNHRARNYQQQDMGRPSADERGYDADWKAFRAWFISKYPLCADCSEEGRLTLAREVHHVIKLRDSPQLRLIESNCLGLCTTHHSKRTKRGE
jgi:5-methylcytosine-specific restriction protein A